MFYRFLRRSFVFLARLWVPIVFKLKITGREHLPSEGSPLVVISNHFTWFEPLFITTFLPYDISYVAATELQRFLWARILIRVFKAIPIWRGQIDRRALRQATEHLQAGGVIGIFPEGGVDPRLQEAIAKGQQIMQTQGHIVRESGELIPARPGASYIAVRSGARLLPVALVGTEKIPATLRKLRRPEVHMIIGPTFGPLTLESAPVNSSRSKQIESLGHLMMHHLAALFPPENRGPYRDPDYPYQKLAQSEEVSV